MAHSQISITQIDNGWILHGSEESLFGGSHHIRAFSCEDQAMMPHVLDNMLEKLRALLGSTLRDGAGSTVPRAFVDDALLLNEDQVRQFIVDRRSLVTAGPELTSKEKMVLHQVAVPFGESFVQECPNLYRLLHAGDWKSAKVILPPHI